VPGLRDGRPGYLGLSEPQFLEAGRASELPVGSVRSVVLDGKRIALYHTARGFFASDNVCPHRGGPLAEGDLIGNEIVCPWHLWSFDVESGANPGNPESVMRTHEVRLEGDRILVRLSQSESVNGPETFTEA
jgi:nitrite reductase (NADH) small subunit